MLTLRDRCSIVHGPSIRWGALLAAAIFLQTAGSTGSVAQEKPTPGGTMVVGIESEPTTLNPYLNTGSETIAPAQHIFQRIVETDLKFNILPGVAKSWEISPDGLSYTFKLADNMKWSDGKPVTSKDVQWSLMEPTRKFHPRLGSLFTSIIDRVDTPDPLTAVMRLKYPFASMLTVLAFSGGPAVLPEHIYAGKDFKSNPANTNPVGSGPYKLKEWSRGSHITLERSNTFYAKETAYLDQIVFQFLPDVNSRWLALETGEVDFLNYYMVPLEQVAQGEKNPKLVLNEDGGAGTGALAGLIVNTRTGPLAKREVRQALAYAIDRDALVKRAFLGRGKVGKSVMHSGLAPFFNASVPDYPYNVAKANQLLDQAGVPRDASGTRFSMRITWATGRDVETAEAQLIQDQLSAVGIKVVLQRVDRATAIKNVYVDRDFDTALWVLSTGPEPTMQITRSYDTRSIQPVAFTNASGYSNPVTDKMFDTESSLVDTTARIKMWHDIQNILLTDLPFLPLVEIPVTNFYNARFADVVTTPYINSPFVGRAWMKKK